MEKEETSWRYSGGDFDPDLYYGFIYRIRFNLTGEKYIGKKTFHRTLKKKRMGPSDWKCYTSSSEHVNALIKEYGRDCFDFDIILLCKTKAIWSHAECNILHKLDALTRVDLVWGLPVYLNKRIDAVRWVTKDYPHEEVYMAINNLLTT